MPEFYPYRPDSEPFFPHDQQPSPDQLELYRATMELIQALPEAHPAQTSPDDDTETSNPQHLTEEARQLAVESQSYEPHQDADMMALVDTLFPRPTESVVNTDPPPPASWFHKIKKFFFNTGRHRR